MRLNATLIPFWFAAASGTCLLAGCSGALSPDKARATPVVQAAGGSLSGATLESWLLKSPAPPSTPTADVLASTWINTVLLFDALRAKRSLDDSATTDLVITPDAERGAAREYFAARDAKYPPVTDAQVDSLTDIDGVRVFQDLVLRYPSQDDSTLQIPVVERARQLLKRAKDKDGANFAALVREASQDSVSRAHDGFLPAISHDQISTFPPRVQLIWTLKPGDISGLMGTNGGVHFMRRVTKAEARPGLRNWLAPILAHRADSVFIDSIVSARRVVLTAGALLRTRELAREPVVLMDTSALATWQGGSLSPAWVRSDMLMDEAVTRAQLSNASDAIITAYLHDLAQRRIMLNIIMSQPAPTPAARAAMAPVYRKAMQRMRDEFGARVSQESPADAATQYLDSVVSGKRAYVPLPGALAEYLRSGAKVDVDSVAIRSVLRAAAPAWRVAHARDTTTAKPAPKAKGK